jgi:hypothetical protein
MLQQRFTSAPGRPAAQLTLSARSGSLRRMQLGRFATAPAGSTAAPRTLEEQHMTSVPEKTRVAVLGMDVEAHQCF